MHPNVPHLRFPEFHGEWEKCKVSDVLNFYSTNSLSWDQLEYGTDNMLNLHYGLIHVGLPTMVDLSKDILPAIKKENEPKNFELCKEGDIAFADASEDTNEVAKAIEFYTLEDKAVVCGLHTIHGRDKSNKTVVGYKGYAFSSTAFHHQIRRIAQGTKIYSISAKNFAECYIGIPSKEEQTKIAKLLRLIDERIATQSKLIEDLKKLKSAISKLLFTRKDMLETTIRLADIATLKNGYAFQSSKYNILGKWKIITIANVSGGRYINEEDCNCIINLPNDIQDHQVLKEGDILISLTGNVGRVSLCKSGAYLLNQRVGLLHIEGNIDKEFLYQVLSSRRFENNMVACGQGAAQMNIGKGDVENFVLPYSSKANNIHLVARILHSYDECIINELRELTLLTMQKQYFLAQMFI
ncbi:restriction endonuclease subunit S [Prevotella copri]|uniref:Restriction endonuclease subunit S n=1 Tax=Segatella copri TaxID=165179 RepID=A0AAW9TB09_9BACT|nr:restriction endonuclease subunit S [Segatella copri]MQN30899.1 restriction endonuclease subunit S [Segatella copri]